MDQEEQRITGNLDFYRHTPLRVEAHDEIDPFKETMTFTTVDLFALETTVRRHKERFKTSIHVRLSNGKESAYMISEHALKDMPRSRLVKELSYQLARGLQEAG